MALRIAALFRICFFIKLFVVDVSDSIDVCTQPGRSYICILHLRGGGTTKQNIRNKPQGIDYSKWEKLAETISDENPHQDDAHCRVTALRQPSTVHLNGEECLIDGEIASQTAGYSPGDDDNAMRQPPRKARATSDRSNIKDLKQKFEKTDIPKFISEDKILGKPKAEKKEKPVKPAIQEWVPSKSAWKTVDYSRWEGLDVSEPNCDLQSDETDTEEDDQHVRSQIRADIEYAIAKGNESRLRQALQHAESLVSVGLMTEEELGQGKSALKNMTANRELGISLEDKTISEVLPTLDNSTVAQQKLKHMTRNGARTESFLWSQTEDQVTLHIFVASHVRGPDLTVHVREKKLTIVFHEPQRMKTGDFVRIPAEDRRPVCVLFESKLAYRVRAADNSTDWEMVDLTDVEGGTTLWRRAVRVVLTKKPPGEHWFPSSRPEWDEDYAGPGQWRQSILRVWWSRVRPEDADVDVRGLEGRKGNASCVDDAWRAASAQLREAMPRIPKLDLSAMVEEDAVEVAVNETRARLEALGVRPDSPDWHASMQDAEGRAREATRAEVREAAAVREREEEAERRTEREWLEAQARRRERRRAQGKSEDDYSSSEEERLFPEALFRPSL